MVDGLVSGFQGLDTWGYGGVCFACGFTAVWIWFCVFVGIWVPGVGALWGWYNIPFAFAVSGFGVSV